MNLPIVGYFVHPLLSMQLMQFVTNRGTHLVMFGDDNSDATRTRVADT